MPAWPKHVKLQVESVAYFCSNHAQIEGQNFSHNLFSAKGQKSDRHRVNSIAVSKAATPETHWATEQRRADIHPTSLGECGLPVRECVETKGRMSTKSHCIHADGNISMVAEGAVA
ncbi:hypothetical protein VCV18_002318 [Metarhizium anisopliae]